MAGTGLDCYIADIGFRSRNPLFQNSKTYCKGQAKKRRKLGKKAAKYFTAKDFNFDPATLICLCPANKPMWVKSYTCIRYGKQGVDYAGYLENCRHCKLQSQCMQKPPGRVGRQLFIPIKHVDTTPDYCQEMKDKIDSSQGRREYSKRLGCIEPVYGNICENKGMNRFTLRSQTKVNTQWQMYCLVHNIEKLRHSFGT